MPPIISVSNLNKSYASGTVALDDVSLDIEQGEILALLGPNGAGKTTLISTICGLVTPTSGTVTVGGHDIATEFRAARSLIGLVPQEITIEPFETVLNTAKFSRGLFGKKRDDAYLEKVLRSLSLWDKKDSRNMELSGGMKRRVLIAKALSHNPRVLFLDEPTAGVDVGLRREMWELVKELRAEGVTIILTTHYIEEAEMMADRIGVINKGRLLLVEEKDKLMKQLGRKHLKMELQSPITTLPDSLADYALTLADDGGTLIYDYDTQAERTGITRLIADLAAAGISVRDLDSQQSSLEEVFMTLLEGEVA
ncbi:ABC transporter ATP-binding protein [Actibacterium lipolyticum]|uniref:Daunorubicin/doxorubicin resistance ATP-binding protein DrrA n=1 Tax=Actibacterium lipolyticum TaxID=1524263 RepID=A0A238JZB3_9RHOB|nr:ABC transporter ATP-binding protein [Actibacterium lipolyticum]SMX35202.1 Daunorubicin/doxorubicin resistance ATP-binding protein DrrA [Actibacterium lipolyticum]